MEKVATSSMGENGNRSGGLQKKKKKNEDDITLESEEQSAGTEATTISSLSANGDDEHSTNVLAPVGGTSSKIKTNHLEMEEKEENDYDNDATARFSYITTTTDGTDERRSPGASTLEEHLLELVTTHDEAWLMLATRLGLPRAKAIENTTQAAMGILLLLAKQKKKKEEEECACTHLLCEEEEEHLLEMLTFEEEDELLEEFRDKYLLDSNNGVLELFRRSIFTTFDFEKKGVISNKESIMQWLDHAYSITTARRMVFPPRVILQTKLLNKLTIETKNTKKGGLSFDDIKTCILTEVKAMKSHELAEEKSYEKRSSFEDNTSGRLSKLLPEHQEQLDNEGNCCIFCSWIENILKGVRIPGIMKTTTTRTDDDNNMEMVPISNEHAHCCSGTTSS